MVALLSHPFRLAPGGHVATVDSASSQYVAEQLAMLSLTRPGERPLVPDLGLADPVFTGFDATTLQEQADAFAPPCRIDSVIIEYDDSGLRQNVTVEFSTDDEALDG